MSSVTTPGGREVVFTYDTAARVTSLTYVAAPASCTPGNPASCPGATTLFDYVQPTVTGGGGMTATPDGSRPAGPAGTTGLTRVIDADATGVSTGAAPRTTGNGHYTDYTWTSRDLVMKVTDANGRSRPSTYGADDNLLTTADATGTGGTGAGGQGNVTKYGFGAKPYYNPTSSQAPASRSSTSCVRPPAPYARSTSRSWWRTTPGSARPAPTSWSSCRTVASRPRRSPPGCPRRSRSSPRPRRTRP